MNFTSLEQRRLIERPRELALHRRDLSEGAEADEDGGERGEHLILASAARFKDNSGETDLYHVDGEVLPAQMLDREPRRILKRRMDGAAPQLDRFERGSERAERGSAAPPSDPRRRGSTGGFERASDRPERGGVMDPRRFESSSALTFDRPTARPERSFSAAGQVDRESTRAADENPALEQHKEKDLSVDAMHETVAQYKTALTELTVNSKIIITKLTIFAGDNIHAAKGIVATICAHILEVPSDQKLPSLYLLDSIVKNIGRDYVELFAARLPEVFCEAYRQVDPSLHPKMKRLFETWREVFFGDPLLLIEAQLQFSSVSSNQSPATKPAQSPPQRPGHGIHVNPSYLEAHRQRLQQSSRPPTAETPKDGFSTEVGAKKGYADNFLDYDYVCTDIGAKVGNEMPRTQEAWGKSWPKEDVSLLRSTDSELDQPRYPQGSVLDARHPPSNSRLLIDAYGNIRVPPVLKSPPGMVPPQRDRSRVGGSIQKNWEEEGHKWDDKNARPVDNDWHWEVAKKDSWFPGEGGQDLPEVGAVDKRDVRNCPAMHDQAAWHRDAPLSLPDKSFPMFQREENGIGAVSISERENSAFGLNPGSIQGHQFPADRLHHTSPQHANPMMQLNLRPFSFMQPNQLPLLQSLPALGSLSSSALPGNGSSFGFPPVLPRPIIHPQSLLPPQLSASLSSPSSISVFPSNTYSGHGNIPAINQAQLSEQHTSMHLSLPHSVVQLPLPQPSSSFQASHTQALQVGNPLLDQPSLFEGSSGALPVLPLPSELLQSLKQLQEHLPGFKSMPDNHGLVVQTEQIGVTQQQQQQQQQQQWNQQTLPPVADSQHLGQKLKADGVQTGSENHNPGHLLAAFFGSVAVSSSSAQPVPENSFASPLLRDSTHLSAPPTPSGQPQSLLFAAAHGNFPPVVAAPHKAHPGHALQPPLPPGPPPSSQVASLPSQPLTNITSLLSSLVAQGVISGANSATPFPQPHIGPTSLLASNQNMVSSHIATQVSSDDSSAMAVASTSSGQGLTSVVTDVPSIGAAQMALGFDFKTELLRERHDFVVNALYANPLHQCKTCGLRCKSQDDLMKHMERHAPRNNVQNPSAKLSRSWFANKEEWVKGAHSSISYLSAIPEFLVDQSFSKVEDNEEPAVPADEDQAACTLCGEPFEDFYDDETDLWMYKGAVYLNTVPGMASEDNGPIVHAKCRSTSDVPAMDIMEAGHELEQAKKRLRYSG